jgi:tetratricopeptide (TPR) repeat protein
MATLTQKITTYCFVDRPAINLTPADSSNPNTALLASIASVLSAAATAYQTRDYAAAIDQYHSAESLIYAHLDPQWSPSIGAKLRPLLPRAAPLFDALLSASSQWLNVLSVPTPASPVRPSIAVDASLLSSVATLNGAGLTSVSANAPATAAALADLRLASIYTDQGNTGASTAAVTRARALDASVTGVLTTAAAAAPSAPGVGTPSPAPPVVAAPVVGAPVAAAPVIGTPVAAAPIVGAPVAAAPVIGAPVAAAPIVGAPVAAAPVVAAPVAGAQVAAAPVGAASAASAGALRIDSVAVAQAAPLAALSPQVDTSITLAGRLGVASSIPIVDTIHLPQLPITLLAKKQVGLLTGGKGSIAVQNLQWDASANPDIASIKNLIYTPHILAELPDGLWNVTTLVDAAVVLPHDYFYVIPLGLAQCYQALGDYATAETYFLQAAGYQYINTAVEGPYVWVQLASLYRDWGNSVYQQGDTATALTVYGKVLTLPGPTAPATPLYTLAGLVTATNLATGLIPQLPTLVSTGVGAVSADSVAIASVMLQIYGKMVQIQAGLDFWGSYSNAVPIWTFAYLQQVAINFTQLATQAEQQVINYWMQADQSRLTQKELSNQVSQSNAQVNAAQQQVAQAQASVAAYQAGLTLANTRATDAAQDATEYAATNSHAIILQAEAQQVQGGDDGDFDGVSSMATQLLTQGSISGDSATVGAATQLAANRISQQYQVDSLNRTATEMTQAATVAQAQLTAASAQVTAAQAGLAVTQLDANLAAQTLAVFNADTFTPQVWQGMGNYVLQIYNRYMDMALRAAKLMQQAYNFENDVSLAYIQPYYGGFIEGLLGADALMADIQSFTDDLVRSRRGKKQLVKTSISLASQYGFYFETQLRKSGTMTFETSLDDFDSEYPGTYQGRIRRVTVDVQGIVPPTGISGTLSNNGISLFRLPSDVATPAVPLKARVQNAESLVISDYDPSVDGPLDSSVGNQTGIFEGAGVASSWTLSLPPAVNDINYGTLTDVVLTFLWESRFDPTLTPTVLAGLAARPGYLVRQRTIPLAWLYPDLFYAFVSTGTLTLTLAAADFPINQTAPMISGVSLLLAMKPGQAVQNVTISLTAPGKAAAAGVTDATGTITSQTAGSPWAAVTGGSALGNWVLALTAAANPALAPGGQLNLSSVINMVLVFDYSFTPRA